MNKNLQAFARQQLKSGLHELHPEWQKKFKLMYARDNGKRTVENAVAMDINDVVDQMPEEQLDRAMSQVERSLAKIPQNLS